MNFKPTFQKPSWADSDWETRSRQAMEHIDLFLEPIYCGNSLGDLWPSNDRIYKDLALILLGSDFPSCVKKVRELVLIESEKCECDPCVFHVTPAYNGI